MTAFGIIFNEIKLKESSEIIDKSGKCLNKVSTW